jgi:hypothetical protein
MPKYRRNILETLPNWTQRLLVASLGSFFAKERYCLIDRDYHAYAILNSALYAKSMGYLGMSCIEFGVASGKGIRNIIKISEHVTKLTGIDIRVYGFDTGTGLPPPFDYRDNPDKWAAGDYPMPSPEELSKIIGVKGKLHLGLIKDTLPVYKKEVDKDYPIGFISFDVDYYSSTIDAMSLIDLDADFFLPVVWCYFDDCYGSMFANEFCGELLAIKEFNQENDMKKIVKDRLVRKAHSQVYYRDFFEKMYFLHFFDHPNRRNSSKSKTC